MECTQARAGGEHDRQLLDSISLPEKQSNTLFAALLLTAICIFAAGNLLLQDASVLRQTAPIAITCLAVIFVFYGLSRRLGSAAWGLVFSYGLMALIGNARWHWLAPLFYLLAVFGLVDAIRFLRVGMREIPLLLLMALTATAVIIGHGGTYTFFDMLQRVQSGAAHYDMLFHASIAAMIKNYGLVSTGLHGLVETPYHALSHMLVAGVSVLSGAGVLEVYGVAPQMLFVPVLVFSIVACCAMLGRTDSRSIPLAWALACFLLILAPRLFGKWAFWDSYLASESFTVSLGFLMLGLPLLFKRKLSVADLILAASVAGLAGAAKAPVGLMFAGLWWLRAVILRRGRVPADWLALALVAAVAALVAFHAASANAPTTIVPFGSIPGYSWRGSDLAAAVQNLSGPGPVTGNSVGWALAAILSFVAFHFSLSRLVVAGFVRKQGVRALVDAPAALFSLGAMAAGLLIVGLFDLPGGAAFYFSSIAFFVALPLVTTMMVNGLGKLRLRPGLGNLVVNFVMLPLVLLLAIADGRKAAREIAASHRTNAQQHNVLVDSLLKLRHHAPLNIVLRPGKEQLTGNPIKACFAQPFIYPAVSERPWAGVIQTGEHCLFQYYGYAQYGLTAGHQEITVRPVVPLGMKEVPWSIPGSH